MGRFTGKQGVVLGVANEDSIAWAVAARLISEGAVIGFSHLPDKPEDEKKKNHRRVAKCTEKHPEHVKFLAPLDVNNDEHLDQFVERTRAEFGQIDFLVHSIAFALIDDLRRDSIDTSRAGFKLAMETSAYSLIACCQRFRPLLKPGSSVVTMTYYGGEKVVPGYNIMGICKAALDASMKYVAYDLGPSGIRVNAVSAGPLRTLAGKGAGVDDMLKLYEKMAPLGRNISHEEVAGASAFLLSDDGSGVTGEIFHVDSGYNIMGSPGRLLDAARPGA
jgi:enoyl-[acyl-carrier protein] reductase I